MKRVLHVMGSLERSGMETMLLSSYAEWRRLGYECDVLATAPSAGPVAQTMRDCGYGVFHMPFRGKLRWFPRARFLRDYWKLCARKYDVVHIHVEAGRPLFALIAKLAGRSALAVTPHSTFRFKGLLRLRKMFERHLIRLLGGRYGMISEGVSACEWETFRIRGVRTWNWINTDRFRPPTPEERADARRSLGISSEDFVVTSVGNCSHVKNHNALLRAIALLPETEQPLYLHVGNEEPNQPERALAAELGITNRVRFFGSQTDPRPFFWAANAMIMPSIHEGVGLSAAEAVSCGLPLVCSRVEGLRELALEAKSTVLTDTDPESIAEGLRAVRAGGLQQRRQQAMLDSVRIRERFSMQRGLKSMVNLYQSNEAQTV